MSQRPGSPFSATDTAGNPGSAVSVGTSSTTVVAANAGRIGVWISNDHATQVLYLNLGSGAAVASQGIRVSPGTTLHITTYTGQITGIASGATTPALVAEVGTS